MRRLLPLLIACVIALPAAALASPEAVKQSFLAYKSAILGGDGAAAVELVTYGTHDYYRELADDALTLGKSDLEQLHVVDRMAVLQLRHSVTPPQLEAMSGREIVVYAVDRGWIGKDGAARLQVGDFVVDGAFASGPVLAADGRETPLRIHFIEENGSWHLDLVHMMTAVRPAMEMAIQQTGMSEDEFILYALEVISGRKPGPGIWDPPS